MVDSDRINLNKKLVHNTLMMYGHTAVYPDTIKLIFAQITACAASISLYREDVLNVEEKL